MVFETFDFTEDAKSCFCLLLIVWISQCEPDKCGTCLYVDLFLFVSYLHKVILQLRLDHHTEISKEPHTAKRSLFAYRLLLHKAFCIGRLGPVNQRRFSCFCFFKCGNYFCFSWRVDWRPEVIKCCPLCRAVQSLTDSTASFDRAPSGP